MKSFKSIDSSKVVFETKLFFVIEDGFPVSPGHCLIVSKSMKTTFFDLSTEEQQALVEAIHDTKDWIEKDHSPDGYNIGMNCGEAAGQSVMQFHCHVIPRYQGDMDDPKGGVRYCIPTKGAY